MERGFKEVYIVDSSVCPDLLLMLQLNLFTQFERGLSVNSVHAKGYNYKSVLYFLGEVVARDPVG